MHERPHEEERGGTRRDEERGGEEERVRSGIARDSKGIVTGCVLQGSHNGVLQKRLSQRQRPR